MPETIELLVDSMFEDREDDGLLHCSGDILAPMHHLYLNKLGAEKKPNDAASKLRMLTGTLWHERFEEVVYELGGISEIPLAEGLPEGWAGTADALIPSERRIPEREAPAYRLQDLKTTSVAGLRMNYWIKDTHLWQVSAYYWALDAMGYNIDPEFDILYVGVSGYRPIPSDSEMAYKTLTSKPLPKDVVWNRLERRMRALENLTELPEQDYEYVWEYGIDKKNGLHRVKRTHWLTKFCPYDEMACSCNDPDNIAIEHFDVDDPAEFVYNQIVEDEYAGY